MFFEKLMTLMDFLDLSMTDLVSYSELSRSTLSRYKNNSRTPDPQSDSFQKLIKGICRYADASGKQEALLSFLALSDSKMEEILAALGNYLFSPEQKDITLTGCMNSETMVRAFGKRLDTVMTLLEVSNAKLSHLLNVDASLISRYRNGSRYPKENSAISAALSQVLYDRICNEEKVNAIEDLSGISPENFSLKTFSDWLLHAKDSTPVLLQRANQLIYALEHFTAAPPEIPQAVREMLICPSQAFEITMYRGNEGLRTAVIRFLQEVIAQSATDIWLYSDASTDWMNEDLNFLKVWASLMSECIRKNVHIHIVHNLNRGIDEMTAAIGSWLPLYMFGMLDSYYCTEKNNSSFTNTIFFCPGVSCITASHIRGSEANGIIHYYSEPEILSYYDEAFQIFMKKNRPLIRVYQTLPVHLEANKKILTHDTLYIRDKNSETGFRKMPVREVPFKNVRISLGDKYVTVTRLLAPELTFYFTHPLLCHAFEYLFEYYENNK